jgi:hypothetical protein
VLFDSTPLEIRMRLSDVARKVDAKVLTHTDKAATIEVSHVYAGDTISEMLNAASEATLIVTNMSHNLLPRIAHLLDVPALCLVNNVTPGPEMLDFAEQRGTVLIVSPVDLFQTCGRLYLSLDGSYRPGP